MSYAWAFNERSRQQVQAFEIWLQEEVLDELDIVANGSHALTHRKTSPVEVYDFFRSHGGVLQ